MKFLAEQEKFNSQVDALCSNKIWPEWKFYPYITPRDAERLAHELIVWAKKTEAVRAITALSDFEITQSTFNKWVLQFPELAESWEMVKRIFAEKRERGGLEGRYNPAIVLATMPLYDKDYADHREKMALLKAKESGPGQTVVNVRMDKMPTTDTVPEKAYAAQEGPGGDDE
jgi:hypothetical protein